MEGLIIKLLGRTVNLIALFAPKASAKIAIRLFSTPRKGRLLESQLRFLKTSEQIPIKSNDHLVMTYRWTGKKETVLLAHGWESNSARWKPLIQLLRSNDHEVIALDAPAHGQSGSDQFNALIYSGFLKSAIEHYSPSILIGHSVGGMASVFYLHENGHFKIDKLVLLGAPAHFSGVLDRYRNLMGYSKNVHEAICAFIVNKYGHGPDYYSAAEFSKDLGCKTLIIHDKEDKIIPYQDALLFHSSFKNSELITTEKLGHSLNNKEVHQLIQQFISG